MMMVGATQVFTVAEVIEMGAYLIGVGDRNVVMDASPVFWRTSIPTRYYVSFVQFRACETELVEIALAKKNRHWIAIPIEERDVDRRIILRFLRLLNRQVNETS